MSTQTTNEIARFRTLTGRLRNDSLKYTRVVRTGAAHYEIQCTCGQAGHDEDIKFQSDAITADRCLA